jgi:sugar lactone lactonase YvrE
MDVIADVELALAAGADLGEAPSWDAEERLLIWVDITAGIAHRFDPITGRDETFEIGQPVGAAVPTASGRLALAVRDGFRLLDPGSGRTDPLAEVEATDPPTLMNDGKCDREGRFWAGTKDAEGRRPLGSLYRLDADLRLERVLSGVTISNGLGWSPDGQSMYYIDSATYGVDVLDFDPGPGAVSNRRRLVKLPGPWGLPDGMTVDEEGFLWVAFWGGSTVRRLSPEGDVTSVVELPVTHVTSCAFGGEDLADLYVTSGRAGLSAEQLRHQPAAGGLFRLRPGVRGLPEHAFAG